MSDTITIYGKIVAIDDNQYTEIVVEDLNRDFTDDLKYVTVVKLPNWDFSKPLNINDVGYLQFQSIIGGETQWFDKNKRDFEFYKYTNNYFINFFKQEDVCKQEKFEF